jgi:hypothetical protein
MEGNVVAAFRQRQSLKPLPRTIISDAVEVHRDHFVGCFRLAVRLRVERRGEVQLDADEEEQLMLESAGEEWNRAQEAVWADDVCEEGTRHQGRHIWMDHRYKMGELGEPVDYCQNDKLVVDPREALNDVHGYISPHRGRNLQWLEQAARLKLLHLVLLTGGTRADMVTDDTTGAVKEEVTT